MNQSSYPATVLVGTEAVFEFEAAAELIFDDKAASDKFFELINDKDVLAMRVKGKETFLDRSKTKAVVVGRCDYDDWVRPRRLAQRRPGQVEIAVWTTEGWIGLRY